MANHSINIPLSWDELTQAQLNAWCYDINEFTIAIINNKNVQHKINVAQRNDLLFAMPFLTDEQPVFTKWIITKLTKHTPGNSFSSFNLLQYGTAEVLFFNYNQSKSEDDKHALIAHLFSCDSKIIKTLKPHVQDAILLNYIGMHRHIALSHPNVYQAPQSEENTLAQASSLVSSEPPNWLRIADELAGDKLGTVDLVLEMKCRKALAIIEDRYAKHNQSKQSDNPFAQRNEQQQQND